MELDWTTLALEILNFLVLVWLLKHFFYRPVLAVIEKRRAETAKAIADADAVRGQAEALKAEYLARLPDVEAARETAKRQLDEEIAAERARRLSALDAEIETERKRRETLETHRRREREAVLEQQALTLAARFATQLLARLASPELNAKLADLAVAEMAGAMPEKFEPLRGALREPGARIKVESAYPLDDARRQAFTAALARLAGRALAPEFSEDSALVAGVSVVAGSWVLAASLRDELGFFTGSFEHGV